MRCVRLLWGPGLWRGVPSSARFALSVYTGLSRLLSPRSMIPWFSPGSFHGAYGTHAPFILEGVGQDVSM